MTDFRGKVIRNETIARRQRFVNFLSASEEDAVDFIDDKILFDALNAKVNVTRVGVSKGKHGVTSDSLYQKCLTSP